MKELGLKSKLILGSSCQLHPGLVVHLVTEIHFRPEQKHMLIGELPAIVEDNDIIYINLSRKTNQ